MDEPYSQQQPEDDGALEYWMWCEEQEEIDRLIEADICPRCGEQGGEYTPILGGCAFCP